MRGTLDSSSALMQIERKLCDRDHTLIELLKDMTNRRFVSTSNAFDFGLRIREEQAAGGRSRRQGKKTDVVLPASCSCRLPPFFSIRIPQSARLSVTILRTQSQKIRG